MDAHQLALLASTKRPGWTWHHDQSILRNKDLGIHVTGKVLTERNVTDERELQSLLYLYEERVKQGGRS